MARRDRKPYRLDAAALAQARASQVLALEPSAIGRWSVLALDRPSVELAEQLHTTDAPERSVAVVDVRGPLAQRGEEQICGYLDGYDWVAERLEQALESGADAVVLRIDSPGGDVAGLEEGVRRMLEARAGSPVPVVAYADEHAASAAYWLAAAVADEIYLPRSGSVGSIGCIGALVDETAAMAQDGIGIELVRCPAGKAASHPLGPVTEVARARLEEAVRAAALRFAEAVSVARGASVEAILALDGAMLEGEAAVAALLADGVASWPQTLERAMALAHKEDRMEKESGAAVAAGENQPAVGAATEPATREAETMLLAREVLALTAESTRAAALARVIAWRDAWQARAEEAAAAEADERDALIARLVVAGFDSPATAWADPAVAGERSLRRPSAIYAAVPLEALRARAETLCAQPRAMRELRPAAASERPNLTDAELAYCAAHELDANVFAAKKAAMSASREGNIQ